MLKKITLICFAVFMIASNLSAQLPYVKMLNLSNDELKEKKFKYDSNKNLYSMSKKNKTNQTMNVFNAIGGTTADIKPHQEDYTIYIQKGANNEDAYMSIVFHDENAYHRIETWLAENNIDPIVTRSGKTTIEKFGYDSYDVELETETVGVQTTTRNTGAAAKSFDESYAVYTYTIYTGVPPASKWHSKEAQKKAKKKLKGDKEDINDLM